MIELEKNGYFELAKGTGEIRSILNAFLAKERDPGLYEQVVGKDTVGRPKEMKFSDVLMRCFMQEKDPDTGERRIDKSLVSKYSFYLLISLSETSSAIILSASFALARSSA